MMIQPVLVVVLDDFGWPGVPGESPYLAELFAARGVPRAVSAPWCSASRALFETGLYGFRPENGVGGLFGPRATTSLPIGPWLLAQRVPGADQFGKSHVQAHDDFTWRNRAGYYFHVGPQGNLGDGGNPYGGGYSHYEESLDGTPTEQTEYATSRTARLTAAAIEARASLVLCEFNAEHKPFHYPPGYFGDGSEQDMRRAMRLHLDGLLSRLIPYAIGAGYAVIVCADGAGTIEDGAKGTLETKSVGIQVALTGFDSTFPWIMDLTDVWATAIHLATGVEQADGDGFSVVFGSAKGDRAVAFADQFQGVTGPGDDWREMATDGVWKVIRTVATGQVEALTWLDAPTDPANVTHLVAALDARRGL